MKIWILSDLHLEFADLRRPLVIPNADVCVMAGDLCRGIANGVRWLAEHIANTMPCVYVAGNHEFYKSGIKEELEAGRAAAQDFPNIHFLENEVTVIGGVRFIGATLWTDYRIVGHQRLAMSHARQWMNDYRKIALARKPWKRFAPEAACRLHHVSRRFIQTALQADDGAPTVVVTHHLPHPKSIPQRFSGDLLNAAYASDLSEILELRRPALWVHGHIHDNCDYRVFNTRVIGNPRGYGTENRHFDPQRLVDI